MDFKKELAKFGYNKGNSIDVEILVNEILPSLFSQQERMYSEEEAYKIWKAGQEYWKSSGESKTFEEFIEQFKNK